MFLEEIIEKKELQIVRDLRTARSRANNQNLQFSFSFILKK